MSGTKTAMKTIRTDGAARDRYVRDVLIPLAKERDRSGRGWAQALADELGVHRSRISAWLPGNRGEADAVPEDETFRKLCTHVGADPDEVLTGIAEEAAYEEQLASEDLGASIKTVRLCTSLLSLDPEAREALGTVIRRMGGSPTALGLRELQIAWETVYRECGDGLPLAKWDGHRMTLQIADTGVLRAISD